MITEIILATALGGQPQQPVMPERPTGSAMTNEMMYAPKRPIKKSRYERRHPNPTIKEKRQFNALIMSTRKGYRPQYVNKRKG